MGFRDRLYELQTPEEVEQFLKEYSTSSIFKAGTCHKTMQGFGYVEEALESHENIPVGFIRVVEFRPASNYVAEITNIKHQSPQFILFQNGISVFDVDNWNITPNALQTGLNNFLGSPTLNPIFQTHKNSTTDIQPYRSLLEKLLSNDINISDFKLQWLSTFQHDASLRSTKEFSLLNSLFGDVDKALASQHFTKNNANLSDEDVKHRAQTLLNALDIN